MGNQVSSASFAFGLMIDNFGSNPLETASDVGEMIESKFHKKGNRFQSGII